MRLKMVDFPAPLGPMIQAICPWTTVSSTSCTATNPSKDLVTLSTWSSMLEVLSPPGGGCQGSTMGLTKRLSALILPEVTVDKHSRQNSNQQARPECRQREMQPQGQQGEEQKYDPPDRRKGVELT